MVAAMSLRMVGLSVVTLWPQVWCSGPVTIVGSRHLENRETEASRVSILSQAIASEKPEIGHASTSKRFFSVVSGRSKFARPKGSADRAAFCFAGRGQPALRTLA